MKARTRWTEKMKFVGECEGHSVELDAKPPFGKCEGLTPKGLVAIASAGCTGMDVVALLRKFKQNFDSFEVDVDAPVVEGVQPPVFKEILLSFILKGEAEKEKILDAVKLSLTKYCAVNAMLSRSTPIRYKVILNEVEVGSGVSEFNNS